MVDKKGQTLAASVTDETYDLFTACARMEELDRSNLLNRLIDEYLQDQMRRYQHMKRAVESQI